MTQAPIAIDLYELTEGKVRSLIGHERGSEARAKYGLDQYDDQQGIVIVKIPDDLRVVSPSFFQGMFARSVNRYRDLDKFMLHYQFSGPVIVIAKIMEYARDTLQRHAR